MKSPVASRITQRERLVAEVQRQEEFDAAFTEHFGANDLRTRRQRRWLAVARTALARFDERTR